MFNIGDFTDQFDWNAKVHLQCLVADTKQAFPCKQEGKKVFY